MGYANYVGRVGALAVALGIGAALIGSGPGMAWAQDEGGDPGSQSQNSTPPGETQGDPTQGDPTPGDPTPGDPTPVAPETPEAPETPDENPGGGGGDPAPADPSSQPVVETQPEETGTTGLTTTTGGDSPKVTISSSGGSLTSSVFRQLLGEAAPQAQESHPHVPQEQPVAFRQAAPSTAMDMTEAPSAMDMPGMHHDMDMPGMHHDTDMNDVKFVPISSLGELFAGSRTHRSQMMLNKRLFATLMPGMFVDPDTQKYTPLSNFLWDMNTHMMDEHMNMNMNMNMNMMNMNMGECEGGMGMSGMAGMDMGCDGMDHSITPMMLVTAQGEVKAPETMGHAGHDMGSMPAEAMPLGHDMGSMSMTGHNMGSMLMPAEAMPAGHDMSNMPAESMPSGHDMSNMPGGMPGMPMPPGSTMPDMPGMPNMPGMPGMPAGGHTAVKGLLPSQDGYTFTPENTDIGDGNFAFTITGPDGAPVKDYTTLHDRDLHLIVASDDLQQYAHLHPMLDDSGRWFVKTPSDFSPGKYRAFADFDPEGTQTQLTLGIDLTKPGAAPAAQPLVPSNKDSVDGFDVSLDFTGTEATVTVRRNGAVVTTQPYLAAAGHLVTLREGDLGYLHVHPMDTEPDGPVNFMVSLPSAGTYAMFFDFKVDNVVRTARFVVNQP